jgi:hypothetical protein
MVFKFLFDLLYAEFIPVNEFFFSFFRDIFFFSVRNNLFDLKTFCSSSVKVISVWGVGGQGTEMTHICINLITSPIGVVAHAGCSIHLDVFNAREYTSKPLSSTLLYTFKHV